MLLLKSLVLHGIGSNQNVADDSGPGFRIRLENPSAKFVPGQAIIGEVVLTNDHPKQLKCIQIKFFGKANVHWTEERGSGRRSYTQHFTAEEVYFADEITLFGHENATITLTPGIHSYPFQYALPETCPSSFKHKIGNVSYSMEAIMRRTWYKSDVIKNVPFKVYGTLNLNSRPDLSLPVKVSKHKYICNLLCEMGQVGFVAKLCQRGYVAGDYVNFSAEVDNNSKHQLKALRVKLYQFTTFHANASNRKESSVILKAKAQPVLPGRKQLWVVDNNMLRIPPVPISNLGGCRIIDIQYVLRFELKLPLFWATAFRDIDLTIGTLPLGNRNDYAISNQSNLLNYSHQSNVPLISPTPSYRNQYDDDNETLPPPYEEAIEMLKYTRENYSHE